MYKRSIDDKKEDVWSEKRKASRENSKAWNSFELPWIFYGMPWSETDVSKTDKNIAILRWFERTERIIFAEILTNERFV